MEIKGNKEFDHLILKYNDQTRIFEDKTKEIIYINDQKNAWYVVFMNNNGNKSEYHIPFPKIKVSTNPTKISFDSDNIFINNKKCNDVYLIHKYDRLGYKLYFKNSTTKYVDEINIFNGKVEIDYLDHDVSNSGNITYDYYKTLAKYASDLTCDDLSIEKLLFELYRRIKSINNNSVLYSYLNNKVKKEIMNNYTSIYPFSTNHSQKLAVSNAFKNNLSVISGPPGTGKTQVILNIIANAVIQNKKIAIISNNNTAVENVYDKMKEYGFDFILAHLGNSDNIDSFFNKKDTYKEIVKEIKYDEYNDDLISLYKTIDNLYLKKNELIVLKQQKYELEKEFEHYKNKYLNVEFNYDFKEYDESKKYLELKNYILSRKKIGLISKCILKFKFQIKFSKIDEIDRFCILLDYKYYESRLEFLSTEINNIEKYLEDNNLDNLNNEMKLKSVNKFKNYLVNKYNKLTKVEFNKNNYIQKFNDFVERYPVILSTTQSLLRNCADGFLFDMVVIDEASQSDILSSLLTMNVAKQMVIIGDSKQLAQIDNQNIYDASEKLARKYKIPLYYQYKNNSILKSVLALPCRVTNTVLKEHYRCDARIIQFCNKKFYDNELVICTKTSKEDPLFIVHTVSGNHARKNPEGSGQYNDREAQEIIEIISDLDEKDIGIITPFRAQADYIQKLLEKEYSYIEVDTIHKYQGRQKKVIILSTVVNDLNYEKNNFVTDFITNEQLLNVAISRAIDKLYLVISDKVYKSKNNIYSQLVDYIKYYCKSEAIKEGNVVSIFDKLYKENYDSVMESPLSSKVDSKAEELMYNNLIELLKKYPDYHLSMHVKLSNLINNYNGFNTEEIRYITNRLTHVDFVIFDKITFKPMLCIEVDGTRYHDYAKRRTELDSIKNRILDANNIKILRLKTNCSDEINKIIDYLNSI